MALTRSAVADYDVHEQFQVDTQDNEDHTFCGIMVSGPRFRIYRKNE